MDVEKFLQHIQFEGTPKPDIETLARIQKQHQIHIPYENLDPVTRGAKIVLEK